MKRYAVREIFLTLQGEGTHTGTRALFLRFAGCNVWSGNPEDRERDTAKGCCAAWCDTEFRGTSGPRGGKYTAEELAAVARDVWAAEGSGTIVCTGGEPSLQLDGELVDALHRAGFWVHVETNGSRALPPSVDWVCLSPKPPMPVVPQRFDELKVIFPAGIDPLAFEHLAPQRFVQPVDGLERKQSTARCVEFVMQHPHWKLSTQTHKDLGLP